MKQRTAPQLVMTRSLADGPFLKKNWATSS